MGDYVSHFIPSWYSKFSLFDWRLQKSEKIGLHAQNSIKNRSPTFPEIAAGHLNYQFIAKEGV